ncbi:hypothetical protein L596_015594 [Steinernema carpocapsae]|uniref:Uncharacterized protein n=1 Tax=Steinernema carpocapsae TaxID=34508 RepID=A0A4U5NGP4_STECR|nr:hypothetical protein L596_015594 [Steinernema carpocapsae]
MGRRRSRSPKGSRRERSRDRDSYSSRHHDDYEGQSSSSRSATRGLEAMKNRMKNSLDEALRETAASASTSSLEARSNEYSFSAAESAQRTREIERIDKETGGFKPTQYKSTAGGAGGRVRKDGTGLSEAEKKQREHETAIYGPSSRPMPALEEKPSEIERPKERVVELAHPKLSEDPEVRRKRWLALLQDQRSGLFC